MNRLTISALVLLAGAAAPALAQTAGPSTLQTPYMLPADTSSGVRVISFATNGNGTASRPNETHTNLFTGANTYRLVGIPDGMGIFRTAQDIADGTSTVLVNHELGATAGIVRAHGNTGAFVSMWRIKSDPTAADFLTVVGAADLATTSNLWNGAGFTTYNTATPMLQGWGRHCSADLPAVSAFLFTDLDGNTFGTPERIFMNGEETGAEGRAVAYVVTGPEARQAFQLAPHGRYSWENSVASPLAQRLTIVAGFDDSTPGNVYIYIGEKQNTGNTIERAGLLNGRMYGVVVNGGDNTVQGTQRIEDRVNLLGNATTGPLTTAPFSLALMADQTSRTGVQLQAESDLGNQLNFLRPEDGAWNPANPSQLLFATTDSFNGNSRLWSMDFTNINNPLAGGQITLLADGSNPASLTGGYISASGLTDVRMMDNFGMSRFNQVLIQEDVGNNARLGRLWLYDIAADSMTEVGVNDATRFITGAPNYFGTQDEETSGIVDAWDTIGPGWWVLCMQAHYGIAGELVEGGQLMAIYIPQTLPPAPCLADVTNDGIVDGNDFVGFINAFGEGTVTPPAVSLADVDNDGTVDGNDFIVFINAFSAGC